MEIFRCHTWQQLVLLEIITTFSDSNFFLSLVKCTKSNIFRRNLFNVLNIVPQAFSNVNQQDSRLHPGYFPPSNFVQNAFWGKIHPAVCVLYHICYFSNLKNSNCFSKNPKIWSQIGTFMKYYNFICILNPICCFFPIFNNQNFVFASKKSKFLNKNRYFRTF